MYAVPAFKGQKNITAFDALIECFIIVMGFYILNFDIRVFLLDVFLTLSFIELLPFFIIISVSPTRSLKPNDFLPESKCLFDMAKQKR